MTSLAITLSVVSITVALFAVWALGEIRDALRRSRHSQQMSAQLRDMTEQARAVNAVLEMDHE